MDPMVSERWSLGRGGAALFLPLGFHGLSLLAILAGAGPSAAGDIRATTGPYDLGTRVNGERSCSSGLCVVTGGAVAGSNRFHRFDVFDTNGAITGVNFQTGGASNLIVGVLNGTTIDKPVALSAPGSLFWLSPSGIQIQAGGAFTNVTQLTLSSASGLLFTTPAGSPRPFNVFETTASEVDGLNGSPVAGRSGLVTFSPLGDTASVVISSGAVLTVDESLLLDARQGGAFLVEASISAPATGSVEVAGAQVQVDRSSASTRAGDLTLTADSRGLQMRDSSLRTETGALTVRGTVKESAFFGMESIRTTLFSQSGLLTLSGQGGGPSEGGSNGLTLLDTSVENQTGNIQIRGIGGFDNDSFRVDGLAYADGVLLSATRVVAQRGNIDLIGQAGTALASSFAFARGVVIEDNSSLQSGSRLFLSGESLNSVVASTTLSTGVGIFDTQIVNGDLRIEASSTSPRSFLQGGGTIRGAGTILGSAASNSDESVVFTGTLNPDSGAPGSVPTSFLRVGALNGGGVIFDGANVLIDIYNNTSDVISFFGDPGLRPKVALGGKLQLTVNAPSGYPASGSVFTILADAQPFVNDFASKSVSFAPGTPTDLQVTSGKKDLGSLLGNIYQVTILPSRSSPLSPPSSASAAASPPSPAAHSVPPPRDLSGLEPWIAVSSPYLAPPPLSPQIEGTPTGALNAIPGRASVDPREVARSEVEVREASFEYGPDPRNPQGRVPTTISPVDSGEASLRFQEAEARAQSDTAGKLGLPEQSPPTAAEIQEQLLRIQQAIRTSPPR